MFEAVAAGATDAAIEEIEQLVKAKVGELA